MFRFILATLILQLSAVAMSPQAKCESAIPHLLFFKLKRVLDAKFVEQFESGVEPTPKSLCSKIAPSVSPDYKENRDSKYKMCSHVKTEDDLKKSSDMMNDENGADILNKADSYYDIIADESCTKSNTTRDKLKNGFSKKYNKSFDFMTACLLAYETLDNANALDPRCDKTVDSGKTQKQIEDCQLGINPAQNCPNYTKPTPTNYNNGVKAIYKKAGQTDFRDNTRKRKRLGSSGSSIGR